MPQGSDYMTRTRNNYTKFGGKLRTKEKDGLGAKPGYRVGQNDYLTHLVISDDRSELSPTPYVALNMQITGIKPKAHLKRVRKRQYDNTSDDESTSTSTSTPTRIASSVSDNADNDIRMDLTGKSH